jgi:hypothetical protein
MFDKVLNNNILTHMPFAMIGPNNEDILFFCKYEKTWKICYEIGDENIIKIKTNLDDDTCECAPTAWYEDGQWNVSFISGPPFFLYHMHGKTLDQLSEPKMIIRTRAGFLYKNRIVFSDPEINVHIRDTNDSIIKLDGLIYYISYRYDEPDKLLITYQKNRQKNKIIQCTSEYDLNSNEERILEYNNELLYKSTIFKGMLIHAKRIGAGFEDRKLKLEQSVKFKKVNTMKRHNIDRLIRLNRPIINEWL